MTDMNSLKTWRSHPQDYAVVCHTLMAAGEETVCYLIVDVTHRIPYKIENQAIVRKLAQQMLNAGVPLLTMEETTQLLNRVKTGESER